MSAQNLDSTPLAFQLVPTEQDCTDIGATLVDYYRDKEFDYHRSVKFCCLDIEMLISSYSELGGIVYIYIGYKSSYSLSTSYRFVGNELDYLHTVLTRLSPNLVTGFYLAYKLGLIILLGDRIRETKATT